MHKNSQIIREKGSVESNDILRPRGKWYLKNKIRNENVTVIRIKKKCHCNLKLIFNVCFDRFHLISFYILLMFLLALLLDIPDCDNRSAKKYSEDLEVNLL